MALPLIIDATGIHAPSYQEILDDLQLGFRSIYGEDIYLEADSQDGQALAVFALGIANAYNAAVAAFNSFSPSKAQGAGLSSGVKINGMRRAEATNSSVTLRLVGQAGTVIENGIVSDASGTIDWMLPSFIVIPPAGEVFVTATAKDAGEISAPSHTITKIKTIQAGWQSVNNPDPAAIGAPGEVDAVLRRRQARSTMLPSRSVLDGIAGALLAIPGVTRVMAYENDTAVTDANGIPRNSISIVITGGDDSLIAQTIAKKKTPGCGTYGDISIPVYAPSVAPITIRFFRPDDVPVKIQVRLQPMVGYTTAVEADIKKALVEHINGLPDGEDVYYWRLATPANLANSSEGKTYKITDLLLAPLAGTLGHADVPVSFSKKAKLAPADVDVVVVP